MTRPRLASDPKTVAAALEIMRTAFAYMDGVIDPPSSIHRLTADTLALQELWVIGDPPDACVVLTPKPHALYLGKLAVAAGARGRGLARRLVDHAEQQARDLGLPVLELQTRIELTDNHQAFAALGFAKTGETAHKGFDHITSITMQKRIDP